MIKSRSNVVSERLLKQFRDDKPGCDTAGGEKTHLKYILEVKWIGLRDILDVG